MKKAEYRKGCLRMDSVEREENAGAHSAAARDGNERDDAVSMPTSKHSKIPIEK